MVETIRTDFKARPVYEERIRTSRPYFTFSRGWAFRFVVTVVKYNFEHSLRILINTLKKGRHPVPVSDSFRIPYNGASALKTVNLVRLY